MSTEEKTIQQKHEKIVQKLTTSGESTTGTSSDLTTGILFGVYLHYFLFQSFQV